MFNLKVLYLNKLQKIVHIIRSLYSFSLKFVIIENIRNVPKIKIKIKYKF